MIMGWEPADNKEHKIINCPVPDCPVAKKAKQVAVPRPLSYYELIKQE